MERKIKETPKKPDSVTKDQIKAAVSAVASNLVCSFCEKDKDDVMYLIAGKSGYICNECVMLCMDILSDRIRGRL